MLEIADFRARSCQGVNRRAFLKAGLLTPLAAGLTGRTGEAAPGSRVKSVLVVWLWGAPSHIDTFDPKPNAPSEYRGPFTTIATRNPGVRYTELLPRLAARSDRFTLIRSNRNFHGGHLEAGTMGLTGFPQIVENPPPNFGSVVAKHRGAGALPGFMAIGRGQPRDVVGMMRGYGGGVWGKVHDPFLVQCDAEGQVDVPSLKLLPGLTPQNLSDRRTLLNGLDQLRRTVDATELDKWDATRRRAYALLTAPEARQALDLTREPEKIREAYGTTSFGQSCLLARRLVQAQVPYVQVNWSQYVEAMTPNCDYGWDTHIYNFELLADRHGPLFDRVFSVLLDDLKQQGLLDSTLVLAMGEFGRTPRINGQASRDHWPNVYFSIWAGGGVKPGRVLGDSDKLGQEPLTEAITPAMVGATLMECAGIDTQARAELGVLPGARPIHELF